MVCRKLWIALALALSALCLARAEVEGIQGGDSSSDLIDAESPWMAATLRLARSLNMDDDVAPALLRRLQSLPDVDARVAEPSRQHRRLLGAADEPAFTLTIDRKTYATKSALIKALLNGDENEDELEEQEELLWQYLLSGIDDDEADAEAETTSGLGGGFMDFSV